MYEIILVIKILMISLKAIALDCSSSHNTIEDLACETKPAILKAMTPSIEIPRCTENAKNPIVLTDTSVTTGVFVSCLEDGSVSCLNIARSLAVNGGGIKVNILLKKSELSHFQEEISEVIKMAGPGRLNILPMSADSIPFFIRDIGVVRASTKGAEIIGNPYSMTGSNGYITAREISEKCGIGFDTSYQHINEFQFEKSRAKRNPLDSLRSVFSDPIGKSFDEMQKHITTEQGSDSWAIRRLWPNEISQGPLMGGNFLGLPGGILAVGESDSRSVDPRIIKYFEKNQKVVKINIPSLNVGHIDEVFKVIKTSGGCGYTIIRASPEAAKSFLKSRPASEKFGDISGLKDKIHFSISKGSIQYEAHQNFIKNSNNETEAAFLKATRRNLDVNEVLNDSELMKYWDKTQSEIEYGTQQIIQELNQFNKKECIPKIIDLPTFFTIDGIPKIANPVNGLFLNGRYFRSNVVKSITSKSLQQPVTRDYKELDKFIDARLKSIAPEGIFSIETDYYDNGGGNLHCATLNIYAPCMQ